MQPLLRFVDVTVKKTDGSINRYKVLTRNILRKHHVSVRKSPEQMRQDFINRGIIKAA